jgi:hypothetical protein
MQHTDAGGRVYPHIAHENARRALAVGLHEIALANVSRKLRDDAVHKLVAEQIKLYGEDIVNGAFKSLLSQTTHRQVGMA